jgi:hypothetical protein
VGGCTAGFTRLIGWFLFVVSSMANGRWEEGPALTMVSSSIPQFFSFPVFFFFFFFCLWRQYKQRLQLSTNEKAGSVAWRCSAKVSQPKKPKKNN